MQNSAQIFVSIIFGGFLLFIMNSKASRLFVIFSALYFIIDGAGISRNKNIAILTFLFLSWVSVYLFLKYKPKETKLSEEFIDDLKTRIAVRDALLPQKTNEITVIPANTNFIDVIELTEEEKIANLEKEAALAERATEALLKKREATRKLKKAQEEDAIEAARLQRQLDKEKNPPPPPPPPMTPEQKVQAILELETARSKHIQQLRDAGHPKDSLAIAAIDVEYDNKLKSLHNIRTAK